MKQATHQFTQTTRGKGLYPVTRPIEEWLARQGVAEGLLTVYVPHTSASLVVQENADPDVLTDLNAFFARLAPDGDPAHRHTCEGPDDMPAHIRSALTQTQVSIPVVQGRAALGTWQGVYLFEHRTAPHTRRIVLHLIGE